MKCIISQQGSGSRIYSAHYFGDILPEPFCAEPAPSQNWAGAYLSTERDIRLMYNHLEEQPWLYELLKDYEIIHLYRDPARTFTRKMAKYKKVNSWTRQDLIDHVKFVQTMRDKVNQVFENVIIVHYEDFIRDLYLGEIKEFNHL